MNRLHGDNRHQDCHRIRFAAESHARTNHSLDESKCVPKSTGATSQVRSSNRTKSNIMLYFKQYTLIVRRCVSMRRLICDSSYFREVTPSNHSTWIAKHVLDNLFCINKTIHHFTLSVDTLIFSSNALVSFAYT